MSRIADRPRATSVERDFLRVRLCSPLEERSLRWVDPGPLVLRCPVAAMASGGSSKMKEDTLVGVVGKTANHVSATGRARHDASRDTEFGYTYKKIKQKWYTKQCGEILKTIPERAYKLSCSRVMLER